jgi:hypothetical protein
MYNYTEEKMKGKGPVESEGFMNALSSQAAKMKEKKRKLSKPKALSLVSKTGSGGVAAGEGDSPTPTSAEPQEPMDTSSPTSDQKGEEGSKTKKKTVSWAEDSNLVMVHYFEMDESERAINREHGSFIDAAQREKMREREARESGLMFIRDRLIEMISVRLMITHTFSFSLCLEVTYVAIETYVCIWCCIYVTRERHFIHTYEDLSTSHILLYTQFGKTLLIL